MTKKKNFQTTKYKILSRREYSSDSILFRLEGKLTFEAGQFVQVFLPHIGEATFAPCSDPDDKKGFDLFVHACGNTTDQLVKLLPGDSMLISGPYGKGWPISKLINKNILIIAGGIGIVPIRPLLFNLLKYRSEFKSIKLVYGAKSDHHLLFADEIKTWQKQMTEQHIIVEHKSSNFCGESGLITKALEKIKVNSKNTIALICGPELMLHYCNNILFKNNIAEENIYISFERRMECGIGICQHCNIGKYKVCEDGPVFAWDKIKDELGK